MITQRQTKRAAIWLRSRVIDSDGNDYAAEERHIAAQRRACEHMAERLGAPVTHEYAEHGGTGAIEKRPMLRQMLDELLALPEVGYLIVAGMDRLARNTRDIEAIWLELEAAGVELVIAGEGRLTIAQHHLMHVAAHS